MALCVTIHAVGLTAAVRWMKRRAAPLDGRFWRATGTLIGIAGWSILLHLFEIAVWGFFYVWKQGMPDLQSALYFSAVTYTTTGYGDLVLPKYAGTDEPYLFGRRRTSGPDPARALSTSISSSVNWRSSAAAITWKNFFLFAERCRISCNF
jgi:hypothetical protein